MEMAAERPGGPGETGLLVMLTDDLVIGRRLRQLAHENALALVTPGDFDPAGLPAARPEPAVAVIDLHHPEALALVRGWRARWPDTLLAGFLTVPDRELWIGAQQAGCDLVANRGALLPRLRGLMAQRSREQPGGQAARRFPLFEAADVAGRLGLVFRADDTPAGPLAVYQVAGALHAIADRCPHAGATLSDGEVEAGVVTCPGHGSRFDIGTGERLRGPADAGLALFPLIREGGQVCLVLR